ncbi:MAG: discoidin domain-containing protein [Gemmatimonadota bacterium]|nr:discoidin domain-containing protein [Gemmatimonadota bacterium]
MTAPSLESGARRARATPTATLILCLLFARSSSRAQAAGETRVLDDFATLGAWSAHPSDGVAMRIRPGTGVRGPAMRIDFDFRGGAGYAIARRSLDLPLTPNYEFTFSVRGSAPVENLEFKLADQSGDNVWWLNQRDFHFPPAWRTVRIKKRHITFAWGPRRGGDPDRVATLEIVITAGQGGKGSVWIDELGFTPLPAEHPYTLTPRVVATSTAGAQSPASAFDRDSATSWLSAAPATTQLLTADFGERREFGGLVIDWEPGKRATRYGVEVSSDGARWEKVYAVTAGTGERDFLFLPESDARWLRLRMEKGDSHSYGIRDITVEPVAWGASENAFFTAVARASPRGSYPRYLHGEQSYWTVAGVSGDGHAALLSADGSIEPFAGGFSLEPFVRLDDTLLSWASVTARASLAAGALPIPSVEWTGAPVSLTVTATATGTRGRASLVARYRLRNTTDRELRPTLYVAIRPFQVNPPWQFLGTPGGVARVESLSFEGGAVRLDGGRRVRSLTPAAAFGAASFEQGGIVPFLRAGRLPLARQLRRDKFPHVSGALAYPLVLSPGSTSDVVVAIPLGRGATGEPSGRFDAASARAYGERRLEEATRWWSDALGRVEIRLPPSAARVTETLQAQLAYMLIERDGPALHPGTRSYARAWIRDGAMMSAALLRLGHPEAAREFIEWYAPYQFPSGKVPCCVDARGADAVPENDSHGELVFAIAEYWRFTHDRRFLSAMWPHVTKAVAFIDSLRHSRMTPPYRTADSAAFYGLVPQSISHEGYSDKPMHSYWDDLFTLRGLVDAVEIASALGHREERERFTAMRDAFRADLYRSMERAMVAHRIDFIPGSVELGDFDATSTTIAVAPVGELGSIPDSALRRTFERYWREFVARRDGARPWEDYTPYELRTVGTFVQLGWRDRAQEALDFFFRGQRPAAWRQWAEVVWRDSTTPKFIGDMPHAWVGSDYARSVLDFFAYTRGADSALVVGAGVPMGWITEKPGVLVRGLRTPFGPLDLEMRGEGDVTVRVGGLTRVPPGGVVVSPPLPRSFRTMTLDGVAGEMPPSGEIVLRHLPATLVLHR